MQDDEKHISEEWHDDEQCSEHFTRAVRRGRKAPVYCHVRNERMFRVKDSWSAWLVLGVERPDRPVIHLGRFATYTAAAQAADNRAGKPWR